jgi:hypothetical protein
MKVFAMFALAMASVAVASPATVGRLPAAGKRVLILKADEPGAINEGQP